MSAQLGKCRKKKQCKHSQCMAVDQISKNFCNKTHEKICFYACSWEANDLKPSVCIRLCTGLGDGHVHPPPLMQLCDCVCVSGSVHWQPAVSGPQQAVGRCCRFPPRLRSHDDETGAGKKVFKSFSHTVVEVFSLCIKSKVGAMLNIWIKIIAVFLMFRDIKKI